MGQVLAVFVGYLSCIGEERGMIEDMVVAVKDLREVTFVLESVDPLLGSSPRIEGCRLVEASDYVICCYPRSKILVKLFNSCSSVVFLVPQRKLARDSPGPGFDIRIGCSPGLSFRQGQALLEFQSGTCFSEYRCQRGGHGC